jgi:predicted nucleotidyltransferase component of viral defense system
MQEPIKNLIRSQSHLAIAELQDEVVSIIFDNIHAVLHGGTAIWRCYNGKRFSEDIDVYISKQSYIDKAVDRITMSGLRITLNRKRRGTVYYDVFGGSARVSLQIKIAKKKGALVSYEMLNGVKIEIYSLSPEDLIAEKMEAYADRLLIRDIYDIMILTKHVSEKKNIVGAINAFLFEIKKPKDESVLKDLVYAGVIPSFSDMVSYLNGWCRS